MNAALLFERLGYGDSDPMRLCYRRANSGSGLQFESCRVADAASEAAKHPECNVWFTVNAMRPRKGGGRGNAADVDRLTSLWCDLDIKPGGMKSYDDADSVIAYLSEILNSRPVAIVFSGHGLQPYWALDPDDLETQVTDANRAVAITLVKRWGQLVELIAEKYGGKADDVYDLPRIMRMPDTTNWKVAGEPIETSIAPDIGHPLTITEVRLALDTHLPDVGGAETPPAGSAGDAGQSHSYAALSDVTRALVDRYTEATLGYIGSDLRGTAFWPEGFTDGRGRGWQKVQADAALRLGQLAQAAWCPLTFPHAREIMLAAAPTDGGWSLTDVARTFDAQCRRGEPAPFPQLRDAAGGDAAGGGGQRAVRLTPASAIKIRPVHWLWRDRIALGSMALLGGREGIGKSMIAYTIAADITRGKLRGAHEETPRAVIVAATEDSWEHTIVPRLMAANADLDLVYRVDVTSSEDIGTELSLPRDLIQLEQSVRDVGAAMILLDPLMSRLDSKLDSHKDAEVRLALEPLVRLADKTGAAVVGLIHVNKSTTNDPLTSLMASRAFAAVARAVLFVMTDPDDESMRLLGQPKNNLGSTDLPTLTFRIDSVYVADTEEGPVSTGRVHWIGETDRSIRDVMAEAGESADARSATQEAADWLDDYLTSVGGTDDSATIKAEGRKAGHSVDALKRARSRIKADCQSHGWPRRTWWSLASTQPEPQS